MKEIWMNEKDIERYEVICRLHRKELKVLEAAKLLGLKKRQILRISAAVKENGKAGVIHGNRGRKSNRELDVETECMMHELLEEMYWDFGPTLACEKLNEVHGINVSVETVRQRQIAWGMHTPRKRKSQKAYQQRVRRPSFGELKQMDSSPHAWFEDRGSKCDLMSIIDDATGHVYARFESSETTEGYFRLLKGYVERHGCPGELYTDRHGIFRVNQGKDRSKPTQFHRALQELGIKLICANSPQAKGRVERSFGTLQDRLVKELRLNGISTIDEANAFIDKYLEDYNAKFAKPAANPHNAHRPLKQTHDLNRIFSKREARKVSRNLEIRYKNQILQIQEPGRVNRLKGVTVTILETLDGDLLIEYQGSVLNYHVFEPCPEVQPPIQDSKQLVEEWERRTWHSRQKPAKDHPWRNKRL